MKAWLVVNAFLHSNKFQEINKWLIEAARKKDIDLEIKTNAELQFCIGDGKDDINYEEINFVIFWDKDIPLAKALENRGLRLFNSSDAISVCDNKSLTHLALENHGIRMPRTIVAPMTYTGIGYTNLNFLTSIEDTFGMPMILKECFGSFGQQVYFIKTQEELISKVKELEGKPLLFQKFIQSSFARDLRLQVVGDKVVATMYRYSDDGDFRANISNGGKMKQYLPSKEQMEVAVHVCQIIGLDFAGVDLLFDEMERPIVCEVNSNAHFKNIYECTGINVADQIIDYICSKLL